MTASNTQPKVRRERRIIERPRLIKMLDECEARVILLLAPAGYGKTTLARQWAKTLNGAIWVSLTPAHRDVAALAEDLASGIDGLGGSAASFIREFLRGRSNPQRDAREVAAALAEKARTAGVQWVVIDDYQEIVSAPEVEPIITSLLDRSSARFLIATRTRPNWATPRRAVYGEINEIGQDALAMTEDESGQLLDRRQDHEDLIAQAHGWPAVLALAAGLDPTPAGQDLPSSLHDYLAEEVFRACSETLRSQLLQLPLLPDLSASRLLRQFGERWTAVVDEARGCGFLSGETPPELHPLLREFLLSKLRETAGSAQPAAEAVEECLSCGNWDRALDLIQRFELLHLARPALERAYLPLVRSARLGTLARIAEELRRTESQVSLEADLVDAEVALRDGEYRLAVQIARRVRERLPQEHTLHSRAGAIEGSATTQLADFDASEQAFEVALEHAENSVDLTEAIHGLALAAIYGERESADRRLLDLGAHAKRTCAPLDIARHAASAVARMRLGEGFVDSPYVEDALRSLPYVEDPRARTSVLYSLTYALCLQAELSRAMDVGQQMLADVEEFGLGFAKPHAMWNLAFVELALRRFGEADRHLKFVEQEVQRQPLGHHLLNARVLRSRFLMQLARPEEAYAAVHRPVNDAATPAMHAEYIATRALAFSLLGRDDDAIEAAAVASASSIASEVQVLTTGVQAIVAARAGDSESAVQLITVARQRRTWEPVICCLRSSAALASCLSEHDDARPDLEWLYERSNDLGLARRAGFRVKTSKKPAALLSPRELEVLSLMAQGYRNRDIAQAFVISESTVKVHVRHILEKLGVRSRTQAVARFHEQ